MAKEFQITDEQKVYLVNALEEPLVASQYRYNAKTLEAMAKRGWFTCEEKRISHRNHRYYKVYSVTDIGRAVARQLGLTETD